MLRLLDFGSFPSIIMTDLRFSLFFLLCSWCSVFFFLLKVRDQIAPNYYQLTDIIRTMTIRSTTGLLSGLLLRRIPSSSRQFPKRYAFSTSTSTSTSSTTSTYLVRLGAFAFGTTATILAFDQYNIHADAKKSTPKPIPTNTQTITTPPVTPSGKSPKDGLPYFRKSHIAQQNQKGQSVWVIHGGAVYDITEFIPLHPGGEVILTAAGKSVEPYWNIFSIHKADHVLETLLPYKIGYVDPKDLELLNADPADDPFANDPERHPSLVTRSAKPRNAESSREGLEELVTPNEMFYVRNHLWVPLLDDISEFRLKIDGIGIPTPSSSSDENEDIVELTLDDLKSKFDKVSIMATLQCAGNRRADMSKEKPTNGLQWELGAIGNAVWSGARLRDVLAYVGYPIDTNMADLIKTPSSTELSKKGHATHVQFLGLENYGASVPMHKVLDPLGDVILAYEMNGEPIPRDHGYPLRVVIPGHVAARSVKWVHKITMADSESSSQWQQRDYKGFNPSLKTDPQTGKTLPPAAEDYESSTSIQELPVISAIVQPAPGQVLTPKSAENVELNGYAWSGGGRGIIRVDVSVNGGKDWFEASLQKPTKQPDTFETYNREWSWTHWNLSLPLQKVREMNKDQQEVELVVKAIDSSYNVQPDTFLPIFNVRGVLANAWHRVRVKLPQEEEKKKV